MEMISDNSASGRGAVYVFRRAGTAWQQEAYIKTSSNLPGIRFGESVALAEDTLAAGAPRQPLNTTGSVGAAYVFRRLGAVWQQEAQISPPGGGNFEDLFGASLALAVETLVVGRPYEDGVDVNTGGAFVFRRTGTVWQQEAYIKASNPDNSDQFGGSLAISNDIIAVGAQNEDSPARGINGYQGNDDSGANSGAVYLFRRVGNAWQQEAYIKASNNGILDRFGISVALSGNTLVVGASNEGSESIGVGGNQENDTASDSGAVYVFRRPGSEWLQEAYIKASNTGAGDHFGSSVAVSGDTVVVGATNEDGVSQGIGGDQRDNSATSSGAVYVFH